MTTVALTVNVTKEMNEKLEYLSKKEFKPKSVIVRDAIQAKLDKLSV